MWDFDIEIFPNFFVVLFRHKDTREELLFEISERMDQSEQLIGFLLSKKHVLVAHNGIGYDFIILTYILKNKHAFLSYTTTQKNNQLKKINDMIIDSDKKTLHKTLKSYQKLYKEFFYGIDTMEITRMGYSTKSIKLMGLNLKYPKLKDLPYDPDTVLDNYQMQQVIEYLYGDVDLVTLVRDKVYDRIKLRYAFGKMYNVDILTVADSGMVDVLFNKFYSELTDKFLHEFKNLRTTRNEDIPFSDIILPWVEFQTPQLQKFHKFLLSRSIQYSKIPRKDKDPYKLEKHKHILGFLDTETFPWVTKKDYSSTTKVVDSFNINFGNINYTYALGGLHSKDEPLFLDMRNDEDFYIVDVDGTSFYPFTLLNNVMLVPKHLNTEAFEKFGWFLLNERISAKLLKKVDPMMDIKQKGFKILINTGLFGKYLYPYYWLYDPRSGYGITCNGQLGLLMLAEMETLAGFQVISANTDGLTFLVPKKKLDLFREVYQQWEAKTKYQLEETWFSFIARQNVNNYITHICAEGTIEKLDSTDYYKSKGKQMTKNIYEDLMKGFEFPVIALAVHEYFANNIEPKATIMNHTDIFDFCRGNRVGSQFTNVYAEAEIQVTTHSPKTGKPYKNAKVELVITGEEQAIQRAVRYACCTTGVALMKKKWNEKKNKWDYEYHLAKQLVKILNDIDVSKPIDSYDLNYDWYIEQAWKRIKVVTDAEMPEYLIKYIEQNK